MVLRLWNSLPTRYAIFLAACPGLFDSLGKNNALKNFKLGRIAEKACLICGYNFKQFGQFLAATVIETQEVVIFAVTFEV